MLRAYIITRCILVPFPPYKKKQQQTTESKEIDPRFQSNRLREKEEARRTNYTPVSRLSCSRTSIFECCLSAKVSMACWDMLP